MSAVSRLRAVVETDQLATKISADVEGIDLPDAVRARLMAFAQRRTACLLDLTATMSQEGNPDFYRALAALWLELRFEWQRHNLVSNYRTIRTGQCDLAAFVLAAASSSVLACIEEHLDANDRAHMDEFAAELISGTHHTLSVATIPAVAASDHAA